MLRPLFNQMAFSTTVTSGLELIKRLQKWSSNNLRSSTILCTIDVSDLYTVIPHVEGVLSLKSMLDHLKLKKVNNVRTEAILRLARFVMKNNYFKYNGQYYHQVRGGAMGSPLALTIANCYMFFYEQNIIRQVTNSLGLYLRFIDDIFIIVNWPQRHLSKEVDRWNTFDANIKLSAKIGLHANFLDAHIENKNGQLFTCVYHKPSYEPYYLPLNSIHPLRMKKNIPFAMLLRALRYCSTFESYLKERDNLRMVLILNHYPIQFIDQQFNYMFGKFNVKQAITSINYQQVREQIINSAVKVKEPIDYGHQMFIHFTYCSSMRSFPKKFHTLWNEYFSESPINDVSPILGTRNVKNLQRRLVETRDT
ncbi:unnamed protein product [Adineta ricciae]|uniref:Reverse transcriptase domain-containing protein n=1 Tax=Adineta ricciae TaxID=249248 RepID=A0A815VY73_ADIRI|nr:unnamed protein product [Adineta ricciae]CAF1668767.1 unnamed protein product [Adineta ricciae]